MATSPIFAEVNEKSRTIKFLMYRFTPAMLLVICKVVKEVAVATPGEVEVYVLDGVEVVYRLVTNWTPSYEDKANETH